MNYFKMSLAKEALGDFMIQLKMCLLLTKNTLILSSRSKQT